MNKKFILPIFALLILTSVVSAYGYDYGYSKSYSVTEKYNENGYSYTERASSKTPWGEKTTYTSVKDYDGYYGNRYANPVINYWDNGPFRGYTSRQYVNYKYDDSYNRGKYNTQYYDYYYKPSVAYSSGGAMYWDHGYNGYDCGNGYYCWHN